MGSKKPAVSFKSNEDDVARRRREIRVQLAQEEEEKRKERESQANKMMQRVEKTRSNSRGSSSPDKRRAMQK